MSDDDTEAFEQWFRAEGERYRTQERAGRFAAFLHNEGMLKAAWDAATRRARARREPGLAKVRESLTELVGAMERYQMDVEEPAPAEHRAMMDRARAALAGDAAAGEAELRDAVCEFLRADFLNTGEADSRLRRRAAFKRMARMVDWWPDTTDVARPAAPAKEVQGG